MTVCVIRDCQDGSPPECHKRKSATHVGKRPVKAALTNGKEGDYSAAGS
jgi:hypothetical protein